MSVIHFIIVAALTIYFCANNLDSGLMLKSAHNTNDNWDIGKYTLTLRRNDERLFIEAVNNFTLETYWSDIITEKEARNITLGLFSNSLQTLSELVTDALDRKNNDINIKLEENKESLLLSITLKFYKEVKTFKMDLVKKDHKKLEHLVMELRSENSRLKEEISQLKTQLESFQYTKMIPPQGQVYIVSVASGQMMDIEGGSQKERANVIVWPKNGGLNQKFSIIPIDQEFSLIQAAHSGMVMDVNGSEMNVGARVIQYTKHQRHNQQFRFRRIEGTNQYTIEARHSGLVLEAVGSQVVQSKWNPQNINQRFEFQ